nr:reverse transcriptase domain-containing protein [Tanacetum cinerariifolium]
MSTRSSARNLFPPLDNPELTIRRRSRDDPTLLNNFEMAAEGPGDLRVPDLRTMEDLCQPSLNGRNSCQFHGLSGDDANKHLDKFLHVTQSIKVNGVTDDALRLYLFPHSLTHHATACSEMKSPTSVNVLMNRYSKHGGTFMKRRPEECYDRIENMTAQHNDWDTLVQRNESSSSITSSSDTEIAAPPLATLRTYMMWEPIKIPQPQVMTTNEFTNFIKANDAILKNMQTNMTSLTNSNLELKNMFSQFMKMNTASSSGLGTLPGNTITNPKEELKGITTRSGTAYQGPMIPTTSSSLPLIEFLILNSEPIVAHIIEPVVAPVSALKPNQRPSIPYPSRLHDQKLQLVDRLISRPVGVAKDDFVKVGTFHFAADFVVIDFDADPRVPLILGRSFLKAGRALIDMFKGELTLRVDEEAIKFNLDQTSRYSTNYNNMTANRIDVIDMACEEYSQEVLGFFDVIASGNPTLIRVLGSGVVAEKMAENEENGAPCLGGKLGKQCIIHSVFLKRTTGMG